MEHRTWNPEPETRNTKHGTRNAERGTRNTEHGTQNAKLFKPQTFQTLQTLHPIKTSILFVCLGNICRSPMAEGVFLHILARESALDLFEIDSAGLLDYHEGELPDARMRSHASTRGYFLTHRSRPVTKADFDRFDWIVGMDDQNIRSLMQMTSNPRHVAKIRLITDFCQQLIASQVPDPYYGGDRGFEYVIDLLEDACQGLFEEVGSR